MGECIISRSSGGSLGGAKIETIYKTEIFTENTVWNVPTGIINNEVSVRLFGGGGCGVTIANNLWRLGGGGGWMNNDIINISGSSIIYITIGAGGNKSSFAGGTTKFGQFLSANGGEGAGEQTYRAGNGGSGGGSYWNGYAGTGYQFGGGGSWNPMNNKSRSGNGGYWGGGGGCSGGYSNNNSYGYGGWYNNNGTWKRSGFGGNGGWYNHESDYKYPTNGTNTIGMGLDFEGKGLRGSYVAGGGGGYGGNGGNNHAGGGGGYGGNGGYMGGGGGGYGDDGGNMGGGGGGYGFSHYGHGGDMESNINPSPSGTINTYYEGFPGVCIIQYYKNEIVID